MSPPRELLKSQEGKEARDGSGRSEGETGFAGGRRVVGLRDVGKFSSAETVARIVENQLKDDKKIDPERVITHVGFDEISLKKRHKLYVTLMTDQQFPLDPETL